MILPSLTRQQKIISLAALLGIALASLALYAMIPQSSDADAPAEKTPAFNAELAMIAQELQQYLPSDIDEATTLVSVYVEGTDILVYEYVIDSAFYAMPGVVGNMDEKIPEIMQNQFCTGQSQEIRDLKAKVLYKYLNDQQEFLNQYLLDTQECPA